LVEKPPGRLGGKRTAALAIGGGIGAVVGVALVNALIHAVRQRKRR